MMLSNDSNRIRSRVDELQRNWSRRVDVTKTWYDLIRLHNDLSQDNMESVISNDPRTGYNMAKWLLTPKAWSFEADREFLTDEEALSVGSVENQVNREVKRILMQGRSRLHGNVLAHAIELLLITGWISLASLPTSPWSLTVWHPLTVFPHYDEAGNLVELARKYTLSREEATTRAFREGWEVPMMMPSKVTVRTLWVQTTEGSFFVAMIDNNIVRAIGGSGLPWIPVFCQPAGGLPDDGTIRDEYWREEIGQSLVASVLGIQKNYDRMLTYTQQLLRDSANAKWVERVEAGNGVLTPESLYRRGSIYTIGIGEDIFPIAPEPLPIDLRTHAFDLRNQTQRGLFSDVSFGGVGGEASAFMMAQATASTKQVLEPYQTALSNSLGELMTRNLKLARQFGQDVGGRPLPDDLPSDVDLSFIYDLVIPGDFLQRANAARLLNPNFQLSAETLIRNQFPEVKDPFTEQQKVVTENSLKHPLAIEIQLILEMRQAAAQAGMLGDREIEQLYLSAAQYSEDRILQSSQGSEPTNNLDEIMRQVGR